MKRRIVLNMTSGMGMTLDMKERVKMIASKEFHMKEIFNEKKQNKKDSKKEKENEEMY